MVTQPEKEQQIFDYIHDNSKLGRWSLLTLESLSTRFSDKRFDKKAIKKIVEEMETEGTLVSKRLEYNFYCLSNMQKEVDKKILSYSVPGKVGSYVLMFFIYLFLLSKPSIFNWYSNVIKGESAQLTTYDLLTTGFVVSFFVMWIGGYLLQRLWILYKKRDTEFIRYSWIFYVYLITAIVFVSLYFAFRNVWPTSPITILSYILGTGTAVAGLILALRKVREK